MTPDARLRAEEQALSDWRSARLRRAPHMSSYNGPSVEDAFRAGYQAAADAVDQAVDAAHAEWVHDVISKSWLAKHDAEVVAQAVKGWTICPTVEQGLAAAWQEKLNEAVRAERERWGTWLDAWKARRLTWTPPYYSVSLWDDMVTEAEALRHEPKE